MSEARASGNGGVGWGQGGWNDARMGWAGEGVGRQGTTGSGDRGEPQRKSLMATCMGEAEPKANLLEGKKSCQPTPPPASADPKAYSWEG